MGIASEYDRELGTHLLHQSLRNRRNFGHINWTTKFPIDQYSLEPDHGPSSLGNSGVGVDHDVRQTDVPVNPACEFNSL